MSESPIKEEVFTAAQQFAEYATHSDGPRLDLMSAHSAAMSALIRLLHSHHSTIQAQAALTLALLAADDKRLSKLLVYESTIIPTMIQLIHNFADALQQRSPQSTAPSDERSDGILIETVLAALTRLARAPSVCSTLCESLFARLSILFAAPSLGVQCNTIALISEIANKAHFVDQIIRADLLPPLFMARDKSQHTDITDNARYCLQLMGYNDHDPTALYHALVNDLCAMGFARPNVEVAIRNLRMQKFKQRDSQQAPNNPLSFASFALTGDIDIAHVIAWILDHSPPAQSPSHSTSQSPSSSVNSDTPYQHALAVGGARNVYRAAPVDAAAAEHNNKCGHDDMIASLTEMGFSNDDAARAVSHESSVPRAIDWIEKHKADDSNSWIIIDASTLAPTAVTSVSAPSPLKTRSNSSMYTTGPPLPLAERHLSAPSLINAESIAEGLAADSEAASVEGNRRTDELITDWLVSRGFAEFTSLFISESISVDELPELSDGDLERMGIATVGARKRILKAIRQATATATASSKPPSQHDLSADAAVATAIAHSPQASDVSTAVSLPPSLQLESPQPQSAVVSSLKPSNSHSLFTSRGLLHFAFLTSDPLRGSEMPGLSSKLDLTAETALLQNALTEANRSFTALWDIATSVNLLKMCTYSRALHISGHGDPFHLVLENGLGDVAPLDVRTLSKILSVGGTELKFVFVSACFSSNAAYAFVAAGVPHVIAVQEDTQVSDTSARAFAHHVYLALCQNLSVEEAFNKGRAAVIAANTYNPPCCCAHLHNAPCRKCPICQSPICCATHLPSVSRAVRHVVLPTDDAARRVTQVPALAARPRSLRTTLQRRRRRRMGQPQSAEADEQSSVIAGSLRRTREQCDYDHSATRQAQSIIHRRTARKRQVCTREVRRHLRQRPQTLSRDSSSSNCTDARVISRHRRTDRKGHSHRQRTQRINAHRRRHRLRPRHCRPHRRRLRRASPRPLHLPFLRLLIALAIVFTTRSFLICDTRRRTINIFYSFWTTRTASSSATATACASTCARCSTIRRFTYS